MHRFWFCHRLHRTAQNGSPDYFAAVTPACYLPAVLRLRSAAAGSTVTGSPHGPAVLILITSTYTTRILRVCAHGVCGVRVRLVCVCWLNGSASVAAAG
jgi:hypothetical protein